MMLPEALRSVVVLAAAAEIGPGRIDEYWRACNVPGPPYPKHWCGAFALWAIKQAGLALDVSWVIGKGFASALPITRSPLPGDVAYLDQPWQHHAIVERLDSDTLTTIDGNQPDVRRKIRPRPRDMVFYSIQPYIDAYIEALESSHD